MEVENMNIVYTKYITNALRDISVELRFRNLIELHKLGVYTEEEWRKEVKVYFDWINNNEKGGNR